MSDARPFRVLAVCTANICRSPLIEGLLRTRLDDRFTVASAGVRGFDGAPMDPEAEAELKRLGGDATGFRSRPLSAAIVADADLVLTASREHRSALLEEHPRALRRTFTLRELAAIVPLLDDAATLPELLHGAARHRSSAGDDVDVADPYRRGPERHRLAADLVEQGVDGVAPALLARA